MTWKVSPEHRQRFDQAILAGSLVGAELVTYTTWTGVDVVHRHLLSGGAAYPVFTMLGEKWEVSFEERSPVERFDTEEEALLYLAEKGEEKSATAIASRLLVRAVPGTALYEIMQDFDRARTLLDVEDWALRNSARRTSDEPE